MCCFMGVSGALLGRAKELLLPPLPYPRLEFFQLLALTGRKRGSTSEPGPRPPARVDPLPFAERAVREPRGPLLASLPGREHLHPDSPRPAGGGGGRHVPGPPSPVATAPSAGIKSRVSRGPQGPPPPRVGSRPGTGPLRPPKPTFRSTTESSNHSAWLAIQNMATGKVR